MHMVVLTLDNDAQLLMLIQQSRDCIVTLERFLHQEGDTADPHIVASVNETLTVHKRIVDAAGKTMKDNINAVRH